MHDTCKQKTIVMQNESHPTLQTFTYNPKKMVMGMQQKNFMMVMQQKPQQCSTSCSKQPSQQKWNKHVDKKKGSLKNIK